jgi:hypothetical protein
MIVIREYLPLSRAGLRTDETHGAVDGFASVVEPPIPPEAASQVVVSRAGAV